MKILIYEDNREDLENLVNCINNFFSSTEVVYSIETTIDSGFVINNHLNYDLMFFDVEVHGENGIEVATEVRKRNRDISIIFVTSYSKYLYDGYKAQAIRYFEKPIQQENFDLEFNNVVANYLDEYNGFMDNIISSKKIYFKSILYIEFINRKTEIHFVSGEISKTNYSLKSWFSKLDNDSFAQPYKSLIVNLKHISGFTKSEVLLDNEETLPISRLFKQEFELKYTESLHKRI